MQSCCISGGCLGIVLLATAAIILDILFVRAKMDGDCYNGIKWPVNTLLSSFCSVLHLSLCVCVCTLACMCVHFSLWAYMCYGKLFLFPASS